MYNISYASFHYNLSIDGQTTSNNIAYITKKTMIQRETYLLKGLNSTLYLEFRLHLMPTYNVLKFRYNGK